MTEPRVAIVIVTWNKKDYLINLLESLREIDYQNFSIILVDNASTDGTAEYVKEHFPDITLLLQKENIGGTGGFNAGMTYVVEQGKHDYVWLLDNDVRVEEKTLKKLVDLLEERKDAGIAGSLIRNLIMQELVVSAGGYIDKYSFNPVDYEKNYPYKPSEEVIDVEFTPSCSLLVRRELVVRLGIWDERLFVNWDDIEWCLRFRKAGIKVLVHRGSVVFHEPYTEKPSNPYVVYYQQRNRLYFLLKYHDYLADFNWKKVLFRILIKHHMAILSSERYDGMYSKVSEKILNDLKKGHLGRYEGKSFEPTNQTELLPWEYIRKIVKKREVLISPTTRAMDMSIWFSKLKENIPSEKILLGVQNSRLNCFKDFQLKWIEFDCESMLHQIITSFHKVVIGSSEVFREDLLFSYKIIPCKEGIRIYRGGITVWLKTFLKAVKNAFQSYRYLIRNNPFK